MTKLIEDKNKLVLKIRILYSLISKHAYNRMSTMMTSITKIKMQDIKHTIFYELVTHSQSS